MSELFNADEAIQNLTREADEKGISDSALDELVQDLCSSMASNINNGGSEEQIKFIIAQTGPDGVEQIRKAFEENES